jgi:dihydromonapterin reductase/dihydrofolate reductase
MTERNAIFITGVSKRLGLALAHHFLDEGWQVLGTYRSERSELDSLWDKGATLFQCDFQDMSEVEDLISTVREKQPGLRALIHNASDWLAEGKGIPNGEVFNRMMNVHAKVPYLMNLGLQANIERNGDGLGDIIHITDYVAARGSKKHFAYAASKAALENLTLSFAAAFAPKIKVNAIAPALLKFNEGDDEAYQKKALSKASLPWEGSFEAAIEAVEYLLNSRYITGRTIHLDGGRHLK